MSNVDGNLNEQKGASTQFGKIEESRLQIKEHILPGDICGQDPCKLGSFLPNFAADLPL